MRIEAKEDLEKIEKHFKKLIRRASNLKPVLREIGEDYLDDVFENFDKESSNGRKWKKLNPKTIKARIKKKKWPGKILQVTSRLKNSIDKEVKKREIEIGTNVDYASFVFFGTKHTPERDPFVFSKSREEDTTKKLIKYLEDV